MMFAKIEKIEDGYILRHRDSQSKEKVRFFETLEQIYMYLKRHEKACEQNSDC